MAEASQQFTQSSSSRSGDPGGGTPWLAPDAKSAWNWGDLGGASASKSSYRLLERAVQRDIVPRLASGHPAAAAAPVAGLMADCVETFAGLVLAQNLTVALAYLESIRARGVAAETLYLELLAPTARHFGGLWEEDTLDFGQVTIGLGNLQRLLRDFSPTLPKAPGRQQSRKAGGRRGLLIAAPGEQHTFGLAMVTAFFRRAGWVIWSGAPNGAAELKTILRSQWFDVVGFSLAYEGRLDALRTGIRNVRQASRNPCLRVMVGGPVFIEHPEFVAQIGADAMAVDGQQAVMQAEHLMTLLPA